MIYTKLDGRTLDLSALGAEDRSYFERCLAAYRASMPFAQFLELVEGSGSPLVQAAGGQVTRAVWEHPLFQAARHLEHRVGIAQGVIGVGPHDEPARDPLAPVPHPADARP